MAKAKKEPTWGLIRSRIKRAGREFADFDYESKLSPEEKQWLSKFSAEYYNASFPKAQEPKHATQEDRRKVYQADNERRRDVWNNFGRVNGDPSAAYDYEDEGE